MHPRDHIARSDGRPALVMAGSGERVSFAELDARANAAAHLFRVRGLAPGDRVALWLENSPRYLEIAWAAHNAGLLYVPVSTRLTVEEAAYIVRDCGAKLVIASSKLDHQGLAKELGAAESGSAFASESMPDGKLDSGLRRNDGSGSDARLTRESQSPVPGPQSPVPKTQSPIPNILVTGGPSTWEAATAGQPTTPITDEIRGAAMVYSSGTTGRPKGVTPWLDPVGIGEPPAVTAMLLRLYGFDEQTTYLSTAPMYHTAPLKFCMSVQQAGGTVVMMEKFDAAASLRAIEKHRVTHSQWVPTMFVRLLQLPEGERRFDNSSHRYAIHSAAPCPVEIKQRMLDWWGPIVYEYYGGSESVGQTAITPQEWLQKKGSVGRASRGILHILDEAGNELGPNETGLVYFEGGSRFAYHGDEAKTARAFSRQGWGTFGDIGHVDEDGYLFLTDRRDYVINSGGVNIYPQEAENLLAAHPKVQDVAVFGVPHPEYGEEVKAVVNPRAPAVAGPALAAELIHYCRDRLAHVKCPRSIDFETDMPREPTGKLLKRLLKARYWPQPSQEKEKATAA